MLQIINIVEAYIIDSLQFLQGLLHSHELLATVRAHRDRFLARLLTDLYLHHAASLLRDGAHVLSFILVRPPSRAHGVLRLSTLRAYVLNCKTGTCSVYA